MAINLKPSFGLHFLSLAGWFRPSVFIGFFFPPTWNKYRNLAIFFDFFLFLVNCFSFSKNYFPHSKNNKTPPRNYSQFYELQISSSCFKNKSIPTINNRNQSMEKIQSINYNSRSCKKTMQWVFNLFFVKNLWFWSFVLNYKWIWVNEFFDVYKNSFFF